MKCTNCGAELNDGAKYCASCGAMVEQLDSSSETAGRKSKFLKPLFLGIAVVVVIIVIVAVIVSSSTKNQRETISLEDYLTITCNGYNGYGTVSVSFDEVTYLVELEGKSNIKLTESDNTLSSSLIDDYETLYSVYDATDYAVDKTEGLSNGDVVTITFVYDEEKAKEIGIEFENNTMEYVVSGLGEIVEVDPFEDITVEFEGVSPYVNADVVNNSSDDFISSLYFSLDRSKDIASGETVTVSISTYSEDEDYYAKNYGYTFSQTSKDYLCENADYYPTSADDVNEYALNLMKEQTEKVIDSYFEEVSEYISASDIVYVGYYFLNDDEADSYSTQNFVYMVYSLSVSSYGGDFDTTTVYFCVSYYNVFNCADGTGYVDVEDYFGPWGGTSLKYSLSAGIDTVRGYDSIELLYEEFMASFAEDYTISYVGDLG